MSRLDSNDAFASLDRAAWRATALKACQLAVGASGLDDEAALTALERVSAGERDDAGSAAMRKLSESLDEAAWDAQQSGDATLYDALFHKSRAASALAFALSEEPDDAIYEAAYAVGSPEDLIVRLGT